MHNLQFVAASAFLALLLGGCSGEPSGNDIEAALSKQMDEAYKAAAQAASTNPRSMQAQMMAGVSEKDLKGQIHDLKKLACAKGQTDVNYVCQVEIDRTILGQRIKRAETIKMLKGSSGWQID